MLDVSDRFEGQVLNMGGRPTGLYVNGEHGRILGHRGEELPLRVLRSGVIASLNGTPSGWMLVDGMRLFWGTPAEFERLERGSFAS